MTRNAPEPDSAATGDIRSDDEIDAAELEAVEDEADRERQKTRSAIIGAVALVVVLVLTGIGVYNVVQNSAEPPASPGVTQQAPAAP